MQRKIDRLTKRSKRARTLLLVADTALFDDRVLPIATECAYQ